MPPYTGERYEALVPDTLDIQERAGLAVNVLTEAVDPQADYEMYFPVAERTSQRPCVHIRPEQSTVLTGSGFSGGQVRPTRLGRC